MSRTANGDPASATAAPARTVKVLDLSADLDEVLRGQARQPGRVMEVYEAAERIYRTTVYRPTSAGFSGTTNSDA